MSGTIDLILTRFNCWETEAEKEQYVEQLETLLIEANKAYNEGNELISDAIYDTCMDYLREVHPTSPILYTVWSADDPDTTFDDQLDYFLVKHPMVSIQTIKSKSEKGLRDFFERLPEDEVECVVSFKGNGFAVRVIYEDGHLVKATSRGRSTNGRDLTNQAKRILGEYKEEFSDYGLMELRGEILLPYDHLEKARTFNPAIKNAFTGVSSMLRDSATPQETRLLEIMFFDVFTEELDFETLAEKYTFLEDCGCRVPFFHQFDLDRRTFLKEGEYSLDNLLLGMQVQLQGFPYFTDGIVLSVNALEEFERMGQAEKFRYGNVALKMGHWKQDAYQGIIQEIQWSEGKSKKTPVAVLQEGVLTAAGATVTNIPLYAPCYILMLEAYPGNVIHFRFGGEAGVIPTTPDGRLITEKGIK